MIAYAAPQSNFSQVNPEQCQSISKTELRPELTKSIQDFFDREASFDFDDQVKREWKLLRLDSKIDEAVTRAVTLVQADTGRFDKFLSSWDSSKAEELANQVIIATFEDAALSQSLQKLIENVGQKISSEIELATVKSSSYGVECLQTFIDDQYSGVFLNLFTEKTSRSMRRGSSDFINSLSPESQKYLLSRGLAISGAGSILVGQIARRISQKVTSRVMSKVGQRILGRLGTSVIPFAGEVVGSILLIYDAAQSLSGSFSEIEKQIKSPEIKSSLLSSISVALQEEMVGESPQIAKEIADELYTNWMDFKDNYRETLALVDELPEFKELIDKNRDDISRVTVLVGIALNSMGRRDLVNAVQDGSFAQALTLPPASLEIIKITGNISAAVAWSELAGNLINDVVDLEMYKHLSYKVLDHDLLIDILNLRDPGVIAKLSLLDVADIRKLLTIASPNLIQLASVVSSQDLHRLANYIADLKQSDANDLIKFLIDSDSETIKDTKVMTNIVQSRDIKAAIQFWQEPKNIFVLLKGMFPLATGAISWKLPLSKFGGQFVGVIGVSILLVSLLLAMVVFWLYLSVFVAYRQKIAQLKAIKASENSKD